MSSSRFSVGASNGNKDSGATTDRHEQIYHLVALILGRKTNEVYLRKLKLKREKTKTKTEKQK